MADRSPLFLVLIFWTLIITGVFGAEETRVFCRPGETVHLPCKNTVYLSTSATTWLCYNHTQSKAVELIAGGRKKTNTERLNLDSDCSLIINRVTTEDAGLYTCQQWTGNQKQGADAHVYLHVLDVSVSSSDIAPGLSLTLSCQLFSHNGVSCGELVRSEGFQLFWENQAGVRLNTDSRYQIFSNPDHCNTSLTTTLVSGDDGQQWRCGLYQRNELKTSVTFTVQYSAQDLTTKAEPNSQDPQTAKPAETTKAQAETTTAVTPRKTPAGASKPAGAQTTAAVTPELNTNSTGHSAGTSTAAGAQTTATETPVLNTNSTGNPSVAYTVFSVLSAAALAVFIAAVLCLILRRRRAGPERATGESAMSSVTPVIQEQTDDVTYSEVTPAKKKSPKPAGDHHEDSVTYASISTA